MSQYAEYQDHKAGSLKWNAAIVKISSYTCTFLIIACEKISAVKMMLDYCYYCCVFVLLIAKML